MTTEQSTPSVLLSVRPHFADLLLGGSKTAELRRSQTRILPGSIAVLYASYPQKALVGAVRIESVHMLAPSTVWRRWGSRTGLRRFEFNEYTAGCTTVTALLLDELRAFPTPITLANLRFRWERFVVPQSYRYLHPQELSALLNGEAALLRGLKVRPASSSYGQP